MTVCTAMGLAAQQHQILDTALVSASKFEQNLQSSNRNVLVLKGEEISQAPVESIADLLDFAIGIDARQRGSFGTQTDLSIRGSSFEQVLVLLNGTRLSDPQTGHHLMNLPVSKSDIERVEILLGGGSYIFGGSAFSGAVNIITKSPEKDKMELAASGGSHAAYKVNYSQKFTGKKHRILLSANTAGSEGFKPNTDFTRSNLYGQGSFDLGQQQLRLSGGYTWQDFGAQNFYSDAYPEQYEKTRTLFINAGLQSGEKLKLNREIFWRRHWDEFQLYREGEDFYQYTDGLFIKGNDTAASWYGGHNYHRSDVLGGKLELKFESPAGKTSVSSEYRFEQVASNNLGESLEAPINIAGSRGFYNLGADRHNISAAIEQFKKLGRLDLSAALLLNYNTAYSTDFYPALTAGYNFNRSNKIYSSFNRSFRLPSYTDLYYRLGGAVGSKDLQPENSLNYELGYKFLTEKLFLNISAWRREGNNIIDWVQKCDSCELRASNTSQANFNGVDASLRLSDYPLFDVIRMDYLDLGYSHIFTDNEDFDYESLYVFDYLSNKASLRAQHSVIKNLKLSYSLSYQDRNGTFRNAASGKSQSYDDVLLLNARLSYSYSWAELYISAQNLLDKQYYDRGNVELPGMWLWAGLRSSF